MNLLMRQYINNASLAVCSSHWYPRLDFPQDKDTSNSQRCHPLLAGCCRGFPIPWLLLAFLVWWLVNLYFFPPKPKEEPAAASPQE
jgi:hypothetical protein